MSSIAIAGIVFGSSVAAAVLAIFGKRFLPDHHLCSDSRDVVKLGMGVIATLSALVLGMLVATAKSNFDAQSASVQEMAADVVLLDRALHRMGDAGKDGRGALKIATAATIDSIWPGSSQAPTDVTPIEAKAPLELLYTRIVMIPTTTDEQRDNKAKALEMTAQLARERLRLVAKQENPLSLPFMAVLTVWLTVLFAGYGILAPGNATVVIVLAVSALSVAGAIFLMLELNTPFEGIMRVSSLPLRNALTVVGQ